MKEYKNCFGCKHHQSGLICGAGNQSQCDKWWKDNGKKIPDKDEFDEMPCYEQTESSKMLDSMMNKLNQMGEIIDKKNMSKPLTKLFRPYDGGPAMACAQIHADHYSSTFKHVSEMANQLKVDFSDQLQITDDMIQTGVYGGQRIKGITFVEVFFPIGSDIKIPESYTQIKEIEYKL